MQGPTAAIKSLLFEFNSLNFLTVFLITPFNAPFHPACTHPIIFLVGS